MAQIHTHHEQLTEAKAIIETLFASGHLTPEQVFTPAILQAMGWIQALDPAAAAIIKSRFKREKISLRDLDKSLKSYQPRLLRVVEEGETPPLRIAADCLSDAPLPTLVIPDPFSLQDDATVRLIEDEMTGQHDAQAIAFAPILITGRLENIDDPGQWLRLEWKRGTKWHRYDADRGQALNAQKLLDLASQGFPTFHRFSW
jgi:hypothetical protein